MNINIELFLLCLTALIIGYLIGSIPFGYIVGKFHGIDITKEGSGSTGTTNALRLLGKKAAILVLLGDFLKGFIAPYVAVYICQAILSLIMVMGMSGYSLKRAFFFALIDSYRLLRFHDGMNEYTSISFFVVGSLGALIGHVKSCWIGFKGGKAVATGVGTLFALDWRVGLITAIIWALTVYISKYSSLGALIAVPLSPIFMFLFKAGSVGQWIYVGYCILGAAYIIYKHQANIQRLLSGTEPKVGQAKVEKEIEVEKT